MNKSNLQREEFILVYLSRLNVVGYHGEEGQAEHAQVRKPVDDISSHRKEREKCKWDEAENSPLIAGESLSSGVSQITDPQKSLTMVTSPHKHT